MEASRSESKQAGRHCAPRSESIEHAIHDFPRKCRGRALRVSGLSHPHTPHLIRMSFNSRPSSAPTRGLVATRPDVCACLDLISRDLT